MADFTIRLVRDQAFKAMELFLKKLEEHAATMVRVPYLYSGTRQ